MVGWWTPGRTDVLGDLGEAGFEVGREVAAVGHVDHALVERRVDLAGGQRRHRHAERAHDGRGETDEAALLAGQIGDLGDRHLGVDRLLAVDGRRDIDQAGRRIGLARHVEAAHLVEPGLELVGLREAERESSLVKAKAGILPAS